MALTRTTLSAAITPNLLLIPVSSTAGFPVVGQILSGTGQLVVIDAEKMFLVQVPTSTTILVRNRGADGTQAIAHDVNAPVVTSPLVSDFPPTPPGFSILNPLDFPDQISYGQTGAINVPIKDTKVFLTGSVAQAMTLGAPSLASNGVELFISSNTGFAHTITTPGVSGSTGLFDNGAAGAPFTVLTFPTQPGASVLLMAQNGLWNVVADNPPSSMVFT